MSKVFHENILCKLYWTNVNAVLQSCQTPAIKFQILASFIHIIKFVRIFSSVTFDKPPDPALIESATYIDAVNYFCDMMMEKALDSMKKGGRKPAGAQENVVQAKNTVLVLPKLPQ